MLYDETTESLRITEKESSNSMQKLPNWVVANKFPAFYDTESLTSIEQTARLYGATNTLIENYNTFISIVEEELANFLEEYQLNNEAHEVSVRQLIQDFFDGVETALQLQNSKISSVENSLTVNIGRAVANEIEKGNINVAMAYDESRENLNIAVSNELNASQEIIYDEENEELIHL